jgi:3-phytase/alkaline phosphatase D
MKFWFLIVILLSLTSSVTQAQTETTLPNGVASGDVTQTRAILWTRSTALGKVTFEVSASTDFIQRDMYEAEVTDPLIPVKVEVQGRAPGTQYYYRVTDAAGTSLMGQFRTPADIGQHVGLRFGVSGDWRGDLAPYPAIANVPDGDLDFFVGLGDTVYTDIPSPALPNNALAETPEEFRLKNSEVYSENLGINSWAAVRASTSILAMIDDHEVRNDFAGGEPPGDDPRFSGSGAAYINDSELFENGVQVFQEYNPVRDEYYGETGDPTTANERKLYRYRTWGSDAAIFMLDARSFRNEELEPTRGFGDEALADYQRRAFEPGRTMLGAAQLQDLKNDLLAANQAGITWKFVLVPEPIQNLGPLGAGDRFEGYAAERTELLKFILDNAIQNVVFICADIHGTVVNNVDYQDGPGGEQKPTGTFEVSTGPVAFYTPLGPSLINIGNQVGLVTNAQKSLFDRLPAGAQNLGLLTALNALLTRFGYDTVGLQDSDIDVELVRGAYISATTYSWAEFEVDAQTQQLHVTTYGVPYYARQQMQENPAIRAQQPAVVCEFVVTPK